MVTNLETGFGALSHERKGNCQMVCIEIVEKHPIALFSFFTTSGLPRSVILAFIKRRKYF